MNKTLKGSANAGVTTLTKGDHRGVFYDIFNADEAAEMVMRAEILRGMRKWLETAGTQAAAAQTLGINQARVSDLKRGKINRFSLDLLVRLAERAGLSPKLQLAA